MGLVEMLNDDRTFLVLILVTMAVTTLLWWLPHLIRGLQLRAAKTDALGSAEAGQHCRVEGTARKHRETTGGPFTGEPCLACLIEVERYSPRSDSWNSSLRLREGFGDDHWHPVESITHGVPFLLEAGNGTALIAADDAAFDLELVDDTNRWEIDRDEEPPREISDFAEGYAERTEGDTDILDFSERRRYTEYRLHAGETIYVDGRAADLADSPHALPPSADTVVTGGNPSWFDRFLPAGPGTISDQPLSDVVRTLIKHGLLSVLGSLVLSACAVAAWLFW